MNPTHKRLEQVLSLARKSWPAPVSEEPAPQGDVDFLARRVAAEWVRSRQRPDSLWLWDAVGRWSLAAAAVVCLLAVMWQPGIEATNPFEPLVSEVDDQDPFRDMTP